ncbi:MAG: hypothetical protein KBE65_23435 [Phycisphaerae bacterium]|nr:hypothetical protein [Phycisphaerae bacterium]
MKNSWMNLFLACLFCLMTGIVPAWAGPVITTINFDSLPDMSRIGDAFLSEGIIFDTYSSRVQDELYSAIVVPSGANYAVLTGDFTSLHFVDPLNSSRPATTSFFEFDNLGLYDGRGFFAGLNIVARSLDGSIVDTAYIPPVGPNHLQSIFSTRLEGSGIHSIEFTRIANSAGSAVAGFDNVRFPEVSTVPIPGAVWLLSSGLIGLLGLRKVERNRIS